MVAIQAPLPLCQIIEEVAPITILGADYIQSAVLAQQSTHKITVLAAFKVGVRIDIKALSITSPPVSNRTS